MRAIKTRSTVPQPRTWTCAGRHASQFQLRQRGEEKDVRNELDAFVQAFKARRADRETLLINDAMEMRRAADRLEHYAQNLRPSKPNQYHQLSIPAAYYRGGTSRAVILQTEYLPKDEEERNDAFRQIIGSNDPHGRQLNGMGAGISSLSKICLVDPAPEGADYDLKYTFVGMGIEGNEVDLNGNCGNMAAAIGPYAFNKGTLPFSKSTHKKSPGPDIAYERTVKILNTNTNVMIRSTFFVARGQAWVDPSTSIDGVSGLGTGVTLDFLKPGGSKTGKLLPTGNAVDVINGINVSCVDAANPCVFVKASDLDIDPTILPASFLGSPSKLQKLEDIRAQAAVLMGLCKPGDTPPRVIPKIGIVSPPVEQKVLSKEVNTADSLDLVVRFISDGQPHRAIPLTAALCTAAAAKIPGSIVQQCVRETPVNNGVITIGHPSGRIQVNATMDEKGDVECCTVVRTARRIRHVYYTPKPLTPEEANHQAELLTRNPPEKAGHQAELRSRKPVGKVLMTDKYAQPVSDLVSQHKAWKARKNDR